MTAHKVRMHSGTRACEFTCQFCPKSFTEERYLNKHIDFVHAEQLFHCDICAKALKSIESIRKHMKNVHISRELPFLCSGCGRSFRTRPAMLTHMSTHTGEKPFECTVCGYRCRLKPMLKVHMQTHSEEVKLILFAKYSLSNNLTKFCSSLCSVNLCATNAVAPTAHKSTSTSTNC